MNDLLADWQERCPVCCEALKKHRGALANLVSEVRASEINRRGGLGLKVSVALRVAEHVIQSCEVGGES